MREILPGIFTWGSTYADKPWDLVNLKEETVNSFVMIVRRRPARPSKYREHIRGWRGRWRIFRLWRC